MFYKIGEVAKITGLEPYVLRYWEGEFGLRLSKSKNQQRLYQKKDIEAIERIKTLLYEEKFTIKGAKRKMRERKKGSTEGQAELFGKKSRAVPQEASSALLTEIRKEILEVMTLLEEPLPTEKLPPRSRTS